MVPEQAKRIRTVVASVVGGRGLDCTGARGNLLGDSNVLRLDIRDGPSKQFSKHISLDLQDECFLGVCEL